MSWLDLHMHTLYSDDGEYSPEELLFICRQSGVRTAAVADHNTTSGVTKALAHAPAFGVTLIPAVELDCICGGTELHMLGYWIDPEHPGFAEIEQDVLNKSRAASQERIRPVASLGIGLDAGEILQSARDGVVTGEIIAEHVLARRQNDENPLLLPYRSGGNRADNPLVNFYWDFCSQGKPAFVPIRYISLERAVALIREAGGIPVLAHPGINVGGDLALLDNIFDHGVVGMEVYSSYHSPAQTAFYREQAEKRGLAMSCGSDFHGKIKPAIRCGGVDCGGMEQALLDGLAAKRGVA